MTTNDGLTFYKSSYSGDRAECVEVAHIATDFRKSTYSGQAPNCVEVAHIAESFRKSSYSGQEPNCVEVADLACGAAVRDSKHPASGHIAFPAGEWDAFLATARL